MKKRALILFILLFSSLCGSGCIRKNFNNDSIWVNEENKIKVLATTAMIESVIKEIGREHVQCKVLIKDPLDPHSYELVKGDAEKISGADLIFYNGLGLEHGLSLRKNLMVSEKAIPVCDRVVENHPEFLLFVEGSPDCHMWLDPYIWSHTIEPIVMELCKKDPKNSYDYIAAGKQYHEKLITLHQDIVAALAIIPDARKYLVTGHDAFRYFVKRYFSISEINDWQDRYMSPEGLSPEAQVGIHNVLKVIDYIEKFNVEVVFTESNLNDEVLSKITTFFKNKIKVRIAAQPLLADSMGGKGDYIQMMRHNIDVIVKELTQDE
ncbi:metal ABC transporter solute-binding protein, Zn/Mn family [Candidatus Clavichlamydia salmonicola]|uniref:metal ABC transporter solute-binding protein, Zn/Mn family n=1 Tax=Candidatus Clavichlamydia salmonicola TaxID=469812 RepID=UPI0018913F70|nr:zinc ABC transporter substrate-binding protein [Candidatus Clavichlamydia salmonicola]